MTRSNKRRITRLFYNRFNGPVRWRSADEQAWLDIVPVGREFGSPDYHRFEQLDGYAYDVFGDMTVAAQWLSEPHPALGGISPNDCAHSDSQLQMALDLLGAIKSKNVGAQVQSTFV